MRDSSVRRRRWWSVARICVLVLAGCDRPAARAPRAPLPRIVRVEYGVVTLGQALSPTVAMAGARDTLVALRPDPGSGVERVAVLVDEKGRVKSITSDFPHGVSYDSLRSVYTEFFGPAATSQPVHAGEVPSQLAVWQDSSTELRLLSDPNRSAWTVRRIVRDLRTQSPFMRALLFAPAPTQVDGRGVTHAAQENRT